LRFHAEGPELPDDLLVARDEGKVLFFCGSGVSIAKAGLPGFLGLAEKVMAELRALPDSAPQQLTQLAGTLQAKRVAGVGGIVAADRIFGLLERDFAPADIDRAVGAVLKPKLGADPSAHKTLLDLSRTANGTVQLVTTNFDLLFEAAGPRLKTWTPDNLPELQRGNFDGIVHLHGKLDPAYEKSVGGNLVLSSAEFGRAYLSEAWATRFIRDATEKYSVVFVGYTADDPPVQYLLEALNRDHGRTRQPMYAFQPGLQAEAAALWTHKGVTAIPYDHKDNHTHLWQTLAAWAQRARDPEAWRKKLLRSALAGPEAMAPHERGQVMHLAMTPDGVKAIVTATRLLPASWLLVFDPAERYETPGRRIFTAEAAAIDPFPDYCLDSDPPPPPDEDGSLYRKRDVSKDVLNALVANSFDAPPEERGTIAGNDAVALVDLPKRLRAMTAWIARIADQPLAIWWALNKPLLHPILLNSIEGRFRRVQDKMPDKARPIWRTILDARKPRLHSPFENIYELQDRVTHEGWSTAARRSLIALLQPQLEVTRPVLTAPVKDIARAHPSQIMTITLRYKDEAPPPPIPDGELAAFIPLVRHLLEEAGAQEEERSPFTLNHIPPINADPQITGMAYERDRGFNRLVFWYIGLFQRLLALDLKRARREFDAWLTRDNTLFYRLRVWACGVADFLPPAVATQTLAALNDDAFWTEGGQRDLLLSLKARWSDFDATLRADLEKRLLKGPPHLKGLPIERQRVWQAHTILQRVLWLIEQGCTFQRPTDAILAKARAASPDWKDAYVAHAADSHESKGGFVSTNASIDHIKDAAIRELIALCIADSGRDHQFLVERDPLGGLAKERPIRVLRALVLDGLPDDQARRWAWSKLLQSMARREDKPRRTCLIAHRLAAIPDGIFAVIIPSVSYWLESHAKDLYEVAASLVGQLADRITAVLALPPGDDDAPRKRTSDWFNRAMTSPSGHMVQAMLHDPILNTFGIGAGLPDAWKQRIERVFALPGDHGLFALFIATQSLSWLYLRDPVWTEQHMLSALDVEGERREALLSAFFPAMRIGERKLFERLKGPVMALIGGEMTRPKADPRALMNFALAGWQQTDDDGRWLSDMEMRTALVRGEQEFRTTVLWQINNWPFADKHDFLSRIWPLQLAARSSTVTDRLCYIAFHDPDHFAELAQTLMPFLTPIRRGALMFAAGVPNANELMAAHPGIALDLYWHILPEDSTEWPYDAHQGLEYLFKNVKALRTHPRMIELMRRRRKGYF